MPPTTVRPSPARDVEDAGHPAKEIGRRLRAVRSARGLSLRALATAVGVTASLLSQIETGRVNPSVDTLFAMAEALDLPVPFFFGHDDMGASVQPSPSRGPVVRRAERSRLRLDHDVTWESLLPIEEPGLELIEINYPPGAMSAARAQIHGGRDYGVVLRGTLIVKLGFTEYILGPGDSIAFDATAPHQLRNESEEEAVAVWLVVERDATPFGAAIGGFDRPEQPSRRP